MRKVLTRACRMLLDLARTVTRAVEEGTVPYQLSPTAAEENIAWGKRWIANVVVSLIAGETVRIGRLDLIMLVLFVASVVVSRRRLGRPVIIYQANQVYEQPA